MAAAEAALDTFADRSSAAQQIDRLERTVGVLRRELAELKRQHQRLRIEILGTSNSDKARAAGFRPPPGGAPGDGTVIGLPQLILDAVGDALGEIRGELEERLTALEGRPFDAQVDFQYDGERTLTCRSGRATRMWTIPVLLDAGGYQQGKYYSVGDVVSSGGAMFIAKEAGFLRKPGVGTAWRCCVRAGRDGRDARGSKDT